MSGGANSCYLNIMQICGVPIFEHKAVRVDGLTSTLWTEYSGGTKRVQYSTVPTSSITAETVTVDGVVLSQKSLVECLVHFESLGIFHS